ncbi:MAG: DegV family protein [Oscillospiraceae bacterium]|nr:DegV family protein [Oscillospiraceae bacterium]
MSKGFILSTETTCDMDLTYYRSNNVNILGLTYILQDHEYEEGSDNSLETGEFYKLVREGAMPKTAQVSVEKAAKSFESLVKEGYNVLHLAFSSGLSGTYQACCIAANDVMERYPGAVVRVIDTLAASMGQGLLLTYAIEWKKQGLSLEELAEKIEAEKLHVCHNFTVDDLNHLHRGGRVSKMTAIIGTALGIKPLLHVDDEGHLINVSKTRGRKQSLNWLVDKMAERIGDYENDFFYISHGDCIDDAKYVADLVRKRFGLMKKIVIGNIGPVIGSHSGPGTVALFFMGETRDI